MIKYFQENFGFKQNIPNTHSTTSNVSAEASNIAKALTICHKNFSCTNLNDNPIPSYMPSHAATTPEPQLPEVLEDLPSKGTRFLLSQLGPMLVTLLAQIQVDRGKQTYGGKNWISMALLLPRPAFAARTFLCSSPPLSQLPHSPPLHCLTHAGLSVAACSGGLAVQYGMLLSVTVIKHAMLPE